MTQFAAVVRAGAPVPANLRCAAPGAESGAASARRCAGRRGFTLVELLVVIFIIGIIVGLAVLFFPGFNQRERSAQGASVLHNICLVARQRALLDQAPRGVRLFVDENNTNFITKFQLIAQPEDMTGGTIVTAPDPPKDVPPALVLRYSGVDLTGGFYSDPTLWPVQERDSIQIHGSGLVHELRSYTDTTTNITYPYLIPDPPDPITGQTLSGLMILASPLPRPITVPQPGYKIVRKPRSAGEEPVLMPYGIGIDWRTNQANGLWPVPPLDNSGNPTGAPIDILFSPSGFVMNFAGTDRLIFWVRDMDLPSPLSGNPSLEVVYVQSGLIANFPIDPGNPYGKVK